MRREYDLYDGTSHPNYLKEICRSGNLSKYEIYRKIEKGSVKDDPYTKMLGNFRKLMGFIQNSGVPDKLTYQKLTAFGFKSTNDRPIIGILKFIQFINDEGVPQDNWKAYRNKEKAGIVLAHAIKTGYSELFHIYPDTYRRDNEAIRNFFTAHTTVGQQVVTAMTSTFRTLCELASFEKLKEVSLGSVSDNKQKSDTTNIAQANNQPADGIGTLISSQSENQAISLNINIELHLPAT